MTKEGDIREKHIGEGELYVEDGLHPMPIQNTSVPFHAKDIGEGTGHLTLNIPFEKGKTYQTRGGWPALVIWISQTPVDVATDYGTIWAIHKPGRECESDPIAHSVHDGSAFMPFSMGAPPTYKGHPADILLPEKGGEEPIQNPGQIAR